MPRGAAGPRGSAAPRRLTARGPVSPSTDRSAGAARDGIDGTRRAWVEVDVAALLRNARRLAGRLDDSVGLLPMVKADGYGLGAVRVARALEELDPWGYGVATVDEGAALRRAGIDRRIVLFTTWAGRDGDDAAGLRLEPAVSSVEALRTLAGSVSGDASLPVHLEVDSGMGRLGLLADAHGRWVPEVRRILAGSPVEIASTFTHFHSAESDDEATRGQARRFRRALDGMRRAGLEPGAVHLSNSAAALRHPDLSADLVRPGLYLYGGRGAEPVASVRARVLDVRRVPAGHTVSYGATWTTAEPSRLATLGIGYGDGLRRELSNRWEALVEGRRTPVRGTVCMDMTVVDVSDVPEAEAGAVATLLGRDGEEVVSLEEMAATCGTIPYEILTGLGGRLPRLTVGVGDDEGAAGAGTETRERVE